ncbi:MAG: ABC transporter substrate-binding protein [Solirubrobacteraceae bacterium]
MKRPVNRFITAISNVLWPGARRLTSIGVLLLSLASAGVLLGACGGSDDGGGGASTPAAASVRLKWLHQSQHAGFYAAVDQGYYKDAGLDVTLRPGGPDFPAVQLVTSGSETYGVTGADQILLARDKGVPIVALAAIYRQTPFALMTRKKDGATTAQQLRGKTVGVKFGGNEEITYRAMLKAAGVGKNDVKEEPVKFDLGPFLAGKLDAFPGYAINEILSAEEAGVAVNIIRPADVGLELYGDTLFTTEKEIRENPERVMTFVEATLKGWTWAIENPEPAGKLALKYDANLKTPHETAMMKASIPSIKPDDAAVGTMTDDGWKRVQDTLVSQGALTDGQDLSKAFTTQFLGAPAQ